MAKILKRHIFDGSNKFLQSGATIPKIEDLSEYNPRKLLSPVQKLLVAAPEEAEVGFASTQSPDNESDGGHEQASAIPKLDIDSLTDEEQQELMRLVRKSKTGPSRTSEEDETTEELLSDDDES